MSKNGLVHYDTYPNLSLEPSEYITWGTEGRSARGGLKVVGCHSSSSRPSRCTAWTPASSPPVRSAAWRQSRSSTDRSCRSFCQPTTRHFALICSLAQNVLKKHINQINKSVDQIWPFHFLASEADAVTVSTFFLRTQAETREVWP